MRFITYFFEIKRSRSMGRSRNYIWGPSRAPKARSARVSRRGRRRGGGVCGGVSPPYKGDGSGAVPPPPKFCFTFPC